MAFTSAEIDEIVGYFTAKNNARSARLNGGAGGFKPRSSAPTFGGSRGGVPASIRAASDAAKARLQKPDNAPEGVGDTVNKIINGIPILGPIAQALNPTFGSDVASDIFEPMEENQAPKNTSQWIMNLLGTGAYVTANAAQEGGRVAAQGKAMADRGGPSSVGEALGHSVESTFAPVVGAARGLAEGFGARFDRDGDGKTERPRLWQANFEDVGVNDAIRAGTRNLGATDDGAGFWDNTGTWVATAGVAADIALDPLTWATAGGTGLLAASRAATKATGESLRAGEGLMTATARAGAAGRKAQSEALESYRVIRENKKLNRAERRAAKGQPGATVADQRLAEAAPVAADDLGRVMDETLPEPAPAPAAAAEMPAAPLAAVDDVAEAADPRLAAVEELLPNLRTKGRDVPAEEILGKAVVGGAAKLDESTIANLKTAMGETGLAKAPEQKAALDAVKATPEGAAFLATKLGKGDEAQTVEAVIRQISRAADPEAHPAYAALARTLARAAKPGKAQMTSDSLEAAVRGLLPDLGDDLDAPSLHQALLTAKPVERADILRKMLGGEGEAFKTFDDAIRASVDGQVEASMMRSMLNALGVATKATTATGLAKALGTKGVLAWDELKASIPTPREIYDRHGIDVPTEQAAKAVDVEEAQDAAARVADEAEIEAEAVDAKYGVNFAEGTVDEALPNPGVGGGSSLRAIMAELDEITPHTAEMKNPREWYQAWSAVMRNGKVKAANTRRASGTSTGLRGAERGDYLFEYGLSKLRAVENYQRSLGKMPYLKMTPTANPLYISFGQILEALPEDAVKRALFDLDYRQSAFGKGLTDTARDAQSEGLTVLPTTFAHGVTAAMREGATPESIAQAMMNARMKHRASAFERTPEGEAAIAGLGRAMAEPGFADEMAALHEAQEVVAVAFMKQAADDILAPFANRIMDAIVTNSDRSAMVAAINALKAEIPKISRDLDRSFVRDIVEQRGTNGILNALGRAGTAAARADGRAAARNGNKTPAAQTEKSLEVLDAKKAPGTKKKKPAAAVAAQEKATRADGAREARAYLDDMVEDVDARIADELAAGYREPTDLAVIGSVMEHTAKLGVYQIGARLGRAFIGDFGMEDLKPLQSSLTSGSHALSHDFEQAMRLFAVGGKAGRAFMFGGRRGRIVGANKVLGDDLALGRVATDAELNQHLGLWANTLAKHTEQLSRKYKRPPTREELRIGLLAGGKGVEPLSEAQTDLALNFMEYLDEVFAPVGGPLARSGQATSDTLASLRLHGVPDDALPNPDETLADNAMLWMGIDWTAVEAPLDLLGRWHKGLSAAQVPKTLAAQASHLFDHRSGKLMPAMTADAARKAGWKRIDPDSEGSRLAKHFDPDSFFPPEFIDQVKYADNLLYQLEKSIFGSKEGAQIMRKHVVAPSDFVVHILKSLNTIWNPAHHVGNVLGENAMLLIAGVNPMYQVRAYRVLRAGGRLTHLDDDPLAIYRANFREVDSFTPQYSDKWFGQGSGSTRVNIGGKMVDMTPEELWQEALRRGVAITPRDAKDMVPGNEFGSVLGRSWTRSNQAVNPYSIGDKALGEISATRDNFTRIGHFMSTLENGRYTSLEDALSAAAKEVHDFHPTVQTLSAFDQKYTRRVIFFHTWVRKAADIIVRTALERPALISAASKAQYNAAEAQGMEPESLGAPVGPDPRIADYHREGLLGPTFTGGYSPTGGTDELIDGEEPHLWGASLSLPQIDALQALFGGVPLGKDPFTTMAGAGEAIADNLNPLVKAPGEIIMGSRVGGGADPKDDIGGYMASSTGMPYRVAGAMGLRPKFDLEAATDDEDRAQKKAWNDGEAARTLFNWLSGLKTVDYTNETSRKSAERTRSAWEIKTLGDLGYSREQVKEIRELWKDQQLTTD